jgi:hypothetical protein
MTGKVGWTKTEEGIVGMEFGEDEDGWSSHKGEEIED